MLRFLQRRRERRSDMNLIDFCYVQDNSLSDSICDDVINLFHSNENLHERLDLDKRPNFTQLNFTANVNLNPELHTKILNSTFETLNVYKKKVSETSFWPRSIGFEQFRIKHYRKQTEDQFEYHADATNKETSKRFLAFFWYLSDVEIGGETEFPTLNIKISPKKGRVFIFPPLWMYPHKGNISISHDKYLLSSYLHFG